jgi:hypothetical protein
MCHVLINQLNLYLIQNDDGDDDDEVVEEEMSEMEMENDLFLLKISVYDEDDT